MPRDSPRHCNSYIEFAPVLAVSKVVRDGDPQRGVPEPAPPAVVRKILEQLGLPTDIPSPRPARSPPLDWDDKMNFIDP